MYSLYQLFELTYKQFISNKLIRNNGESEQYTVEVFDNNDSNLVDAKHYVLNQIQSHLGSEFEDLDETFNKKNAQIIEYYNLDDVNSEAFFNATRVDGKVVISTDYPTKDALIKSYRAKDKSQQEIKRSDDERIESLSKENDSLKQYKEAYLSIKDDLTKGQEQIQTLSASLSTEKNNCASLRQQVTSLTNQVEQLKNAANIRQIASSLEKSMGEMMPYLQSIAPTPRNQEYDSQRIEASHSRKNMRKEHTLNKQFFRIVLIILAILLLGGFYYALKGVKSTSEISKLKTENNNLSVQCDLLQGQVNQLKRDAESSRNAYSYEAFFNSAFPNAAIDVEGYSNNGMKVGKTYKVSIKNYQGVGEWELDGFNINKGDVKDNSIKVIPSHEGTLYLNYKVGGVVVKRRALDAK